MKVVLVHTDLRLYWPARLLALHTAILARGDSLIILEIAGNGSPYEFQQKKSNSEILDWRILFPEMRMESISPNLANKAVINALEELKPDIVLAGAIAFPSGAAAIKWGLNRNKPIVIFDNARLEDVPRSWYVNFIKKQIYKGVTAIICPAASHAPTFEWFGFKKNQLFYGLNVIDNDYFARAKMDMLERQDFLFEVPQPCIVSAGRQVAKKNYTFLLKAFKNYIQTNPKSKLNLVLIGDGPEHQKLTELAGSFCNSRIVFFPFIDRYRLCEIYTKASLFVLPSFYGETWGLVVNEAMASGLPVAVSRECGCADTLVQEEENGWKFDPWNEQSLNNIMKKFDQLTDMEIISMQKKSLEIISNWGMDQFVNGTIHAIDFAMIHEHRKIGILSRVFINIWKGRYRPS